MSRSRRGRFEEAASCVDGAMWLTGRLFPESRVPSMVLASCAVTSGAGLWALRGRMAGLGIEVGSMYCRRSGGRVTRVDGALEGSCS